MMTEPDHHTAATAPDPAVSPPAPVVAPRTPVGPPPPTLAPGHRTRERIAAAAVGRLLDRLDDVRVVRDLGGTAARPSAPARPALGSPPLGNASTGAAHEVRIHDERAWTAVLREGSAGLGEGYFRGWWHTDDLVGLLRHLITNFATIDRWQHRAHALSKPVLDPIRKARRPDPSRDRRNVRAHYDLSNEFFAAFLDDTMTYSSAVFRSPYDALADASSEKLDRLCRKLGVDDTTNLLEIGSGWGSFALHAAGRHGARVTTTTVSAAQARLARERIAAAGLGERISLLEEDYRALDGTYDRLVSVEMIEAVDWRDVPSYFSTCARLLRPDGLFGLQAIVIGDQRYERARHTTDFIKQWVFPGGSLPSITSIAQAATAASDLRIVDLEDLGLHYAETLHRWRDTLHERWDDLADLGVTEELGRLWDMYLAYCEAAFLERHVSVVQVVLAKPQWRPAELTVRAD